MIFKLHYWLFVAGLNAICILLGVFMKTYTDASSLEIGALFMIMPFCGLICRPILCSKADRAQAHKKYLIICLMITCISYSPYIIIPYLGPEMYAVHPRLSWYILVVSKVIGDVTLGGAGSIADSLAINYAKRIGTDFSVYRVWGTISWMVFGVITGNINELPFMPKYTPAFMILIGCNTLNLFLIWLWPDEYFHMVMNKDKDPKLLNESQESVEGNMFTKSLMPKEVVLGHMKAKLCRVITGPFRKRASSSERNISNNSYSNNTIELTQRSAVNQVKGQENAKKKGVDKMLQLKILLLLIRRDARILLYSVFFVMAGMSSSTMSFLVMSIPGICEEKGCNASILTGYIQVSMAGTETLLFMYIAKIQKVVGRLDLCALGMLSYSVKYLFYGIYYHQVDPMFALIVECLHGISMVTVLTVMVEMSHQFAKEVEYIIPELLNRGLINPNDSNVDHLKMSLAATMQAFTASSHDCLGPGIGALIYGVLLEHITYSQLWLLVGSVMGGVFIVTMVINVMDRIFKFNLGLEAKAGVIIKDLVEDDYRVESSMKQTVTTVTNESEEIWDICKNRPAIGMNQITGETRAKVE